MLLILAMAQPMSLGVDIVSKIAFPMIMSQISVGTDCCASAERGR